MRCRQRAREVKALTLAYLGACHCCWRLDPMRSHASAWEQNKQQLSLAALGHFKVADFSFELTG